MSQLPQNIFRHWIHSQEEDTGDKEVYRPYDYKFPPVRGRTGLEFKENGELMLYDFAPDDRRRKTLGYWKYEDPDKIEVYFKNENAKAFRIELVLIKDDMLIIKKII